MTKKELAVDQDEMVDDQMEEGGEEAQSADAKALAKLKDAIKVQREDLGGLRVKLTVTIPRDTMDERLQEQFAELKREALIPGFRKGHAPLKLIEKRFAGEVGDELKGKLVSSSYIAATERENLKTLGDPMVWVKTKEERVGDDKKPHQVEVDKLVPFDKALGTLSIPKDGSLTFACEVELRPEFELPELKGIPAQKPTVSIDDDDVDTEIDRLASWRGAFEPVEDGPAEEDDMLYADMTMTVDSEMLTQETNIEVPARDVRLKGVPLEGLGKVLMGKKPGDRASIKAEVPNDHEYDSARGKTATFDFTIHEIKRWTPRPIDDEFLSSLGVESEDDLRNQIRTTLERKLERTLHDKMLSQIAEHLVDNTKIDVPEGVSNRQTDRAIARRAIELLQRGMPHNEVEKQIDSMRGSAREQVIRDLKLFFILENIADEREIEVNEEEVNAAIADIAKTTGKRFDRVRDELSKQDGMMSLYLRIRDEKVLEQLLEDAKITQVEGPPKSATPKKPRAAANAIAPMEKATAEPRTKTEAPAKTEKNKPAEKAKATKVQEKVPAKANPKAGAKSASPNKGDAKKKKK
ncbi:MAG: trigger factor [Planctomycetes bacterium]|nr:trigger factor [Planctomycetota bacterium]MBI3834371.1 trigger factor [Planctomycetota bacterium]